MCFGNASRIAEHKAEEAKRAASRIAGDSERRVAAIQAQADAIKPQYTPPPATPPTPQKSTPLPAMVSSTLASNSGVKSSMSKRKSTQNINKGIAALRIPLNTGGTGSNSNVNIG
jgi:hypothetical protein